MDLMVGGRACGKTTFLREQAFNAFKAGEYVQVVVPNAERTRSWLDWFAMVTLVDPPAPNERRGVIEILIPADMDKARGIEWTKRFVDDAEEVLFQLLHGYDIAVASGHLFGR